MLIYQEQIDMREWLKAEVNSLKESSSAACDWVK